jgi:hypothetical protein
MRTNEEILKVFDEGFPKFKWFLDKYFNEGLMETLIWARQTRNITALLGILNQAWFELPDSIFNIVNNPPGWGEFLKVIEE